MTRSEFRAMRCHTLEGPDSLRLDVLPVRDPEPGEVRVRIAAAGVNFPDLLVTWNQYQTKPDLPFAPGMEAAGTVVACGAGVVHVAPGDRVFALPGAAFGAFAEEITLQAALVQRLPDSLGMGLHAAAAMMLAYRTSAVALIARGALQQGETLVVHGAAGGVGLAAVQIGKALGARVIATASTDEKLAVLMQEGADHVINSATQSIRDEVRALTDGRGADVFLDPVGGDVFDQSLRAVAPGGRLLVAGFTAGRFNAVQSNIVLIKEISLIGVRAGEWAKRHPQAAEALVQRLLGWAEAGRVRPRIAASFPLAQAGAALKGLAERRVIGKYVVTMEE